MEIQLPFAEAVALAAAKQPIPPMVRSLRCAGSTVHADVDLAAIRRSSLVMSLAFAAAGVLAVEATFAGFADGVALFRMTAHARGVPLHRLLRFAIPMVQSSLAKSGLPAGAVEVTVGEGDPVVRIQVQQVLETAVEGIRIRSFDLQDAVLELHAEVGNVRLVEDAPGPAA